MGPNEIARLVAMDKQHLWHPFTQMETWVEEEPLVIESARGAELIDVEGRTYLDGVSSLWTNVHGHRVAEIDQALRDQLDRVAHTTLLGLSSVPAIELAQDLARIAPPGLEKVFYSDSGSTAVEVALKMAFQFWRQGGAAGRQKTRFACLSGAYHGDTIGSVSVGGIDLFHSLYKPLLFDSITLPSPYCYRCSFGLEHPRCAMACADQTVETIHAHREELAAVVMEPLVQGAAGIIVHPEGYLTRVAEACRESGVLLILDEVATGFGRTGSLFACRQEEVTCDLLALAKGLSGGYLPLAATLASRRIFDGFLGSPQSGRTFYHGHTYTGNPLACAAARASLSLFEKNGVLHNVAARSAELSARLDKLSDLPCLGDTRIRGLMAGIELVRDKKTREPFDPALRLGHRVILEARRRGAILRPLGDVIVIMPPLSITAEELDGLLNILEASLVAVVESL